MNGWTVIGTLAQQLSDRMKAERMAKALEFYADSQNYFHDVGEMPAVHRDEGDVARAALREAGWRKW